MSLPLTRLPPTSGPTTQTTPDKDAVTSEGFASYIRREFERRLNERRPFEQQWLLNLAYIEGNHYAEVNESTGDIYVPTKNYDWEQRDAFNHIAPIYETRVAKLNRNRPMLTVRPGSNDEEDVSTAKVSSKLLQFNWDAQKADAIISEGTAWAESCGTGFLKSLWNPGKGPTVTDPGGGQDMPIGDIETIVCSPFTVFPDDALKPKLEDQRSVIHAMSMPLDSDHVQMLVEYHNQQFPDQPFSPISEDVTSVTVGKGNTAKSGTPALRFSVDNLKNHVMVIEYYERPSRKYPKGRFGIVINDTLIHYGGLPYVKDPTFPIVKIDCIRRPNCFWGKSVIDRLIPVQKRYNALRNRVAEYLNRVGMGQWIAEENTVDEDALTNEPGLVVYYTRGARAPTPAQFPPLPSTFMDEQNTLEQEFMKISGLHEVSHAQLPSGAGGAPSGVMVAQLQEQDDTRIATTQRYLDEAVEKMGTQWLLRYSEFAHEQRAFPVTGRNSSIHIMYFDANTIKSHNVVIEASSALANSPAARREMVFAMLDRGLFNDPNTGKPTAQGLQKVFEMLELGNWDEYDEDQSLPKNRALWECELMVAGKPVPIFQWEDHLVHLAVLTRFRQTERFYDLMETPEGPMIAQLFQQHEQMHQYFLNIQFQQQQMMAPLAPPEQAPA